MLIYTAAINKCCLDTNFDTHQIVYNWELLLSGDSSIAKDCSVLFNCCSVYLEVCEILECNKCVPSFDYQSSVEQWICNKEQFTVISKGLMVNKLNNFEC